MVKVDRKELLAVMRDAASILMRPGIPALTGALLEATELGIRVTTTNLETTYRNVVGIVAEGSSYVVSGLMGDDGRTPTPALVPARMLKDMLSKLKDATVELGVTGERFTVRRPNGAEIGIRLLPVGDFPTISDPDGPSYAVDAADLARVLDTVLSSASSDTARPTLTAVSVEIRSGELTACATDSYQLAAARCAVSDGPDVATLVPGDAGVKHVRKSLGAKPAGKVFATFGEHDEATFTLSDGPTWRIRHVEGQFPNWRQLVPDGGSARLTYDEAELLEALAAAALVVDSSSTARAPVRLELNAHVRVTGTSADGTTYAQTLAGASWNGEELTAAYDPARFADCVRASGGADVYIRDGLKPATFGNTLRADLPERFALLMPVRLPAPIA